MAPQKFWQTVRAGTKVARMLITPARRAPAPAVYLADPWRPGSRAQALPDVGRGAQIARRTGGLLVLALIGLLAFALLALVMVLMGIGLFSGHAAAGWMMLITLMLAFAGAWWWWRRAGQLLHPEPAPVTPEGVTHEAEARLLKLLRHNERILPRMNGEAFHGAVISIRDALRATANDITVTRERYDARQAAETELPALLEAYYSAPGPETARDLNELLGVLQGRMDRIVELRTRPSNALEQERRYLEEKYGEE